MKNRQLGKNGFTISEVGLGCWQFGGDFGPMDENTAMDIMEQAVTSGVNFFDTANVYGDGLSESLIGRFMQQSSTPLTVASKFGRGDVYPNNYTPDTLRKSVEASLEKLQMNSVDLLQLHCIPTEVLQQGDIFDWLRQLQQEGLIKAFGASVETVEEALICLKQEGILSIQVIFNIFRQKLIPELLPQAKEKGVGIIVRLPLASGLLSGKYTQASTFAETDHRNFNRDGKFFNVGETFAGIPFATGVEIVEKIKPLVPADMSMAQMAMRWILDHDAISVIIPGASSTKQAKENAAISALPTLPEELHQALAKLYKENIQQHIRGAY